MVEFGSMISVVLMLKCYALDVHVSFTVVILGTVWDIRFGYHNVFAGSAFTKHCCAVLQVCIFKLSMFHSSILLIYGRIVFTWLAQEGVSY